MRIRWLGTAGHALEAGGTTVLLDPFLTRPSIFTTAARRLRPTPARWRSFLPPRVDAVLLGHSHYDHLMDAPLIAREAGALIVGSPSTASFARAEGVAEDKIVTVPPTGRSLSVGAFTIRFVPSLHGRLLAGRVPLPGEVTTPPRLPARLFDYRMGGAFGIHLEACGVSVYHNGSANLVDAELDGLGARVVLLGLAGRYGTPDYARRVTDRLRPELVVPTHHDAFFAPLEEGVRLLPGIDLGGFVRELGRVSPDSRVITPTYDDVLVVPEDQPASEAVLIDR